MSLLYPFNLINNIFLTTFVESFHELAFIRISLKKLELKLLKKKEPHSTSLRLPTPIPWFGVYPRNSLSYPKLPIQFHESN